MGAMLKAAVAVGGMDWEMVVEAWAATEVTRTAAIAAMRPARILMDVGCDEASRCYLYGRVKMLWQAGESCWCKIERCGGGWLEIYVREKRGEEPHMQLFVEQLWEGGALRGRQVFANCLQWWRGKERRRKRERRGWGGWRWIGNDTE
jgi:hypothetical protein